jgi:hypothetical protein
MAAAPARVAAAHRGRGRGCHWGRARGCLLPRRRPRRPNDVIRGEAHILSLAARIARAIGQGCTGRGQASRGPAFAVGAICFPQGSKLAPENMAAGT